MTVQRLREYVALHVLAHHRDLMTTDARQGRAEWTQLVTPVAGGRRVGIMGLGRIGAACAQTLAALGFNTAGWSRTPHDIDGVTVFHGDAGLRDFVSGAEILVCLLPLTDRTRDILNEDLFARLPRGAAVLNAGRGGHLVEADLIAALDRGQLSGATLDVFRTEPLPADHPFWHHPASASPRISPPVSTRPPGRPWWPTASSPSKPPAPPPMWAMPIAATKFRRRVSTAAGGAHHPPRAARSGLPARIPGVPRGGRRPPEHRASDPLARSRGSLQSPSAPVGDRPRVGRIGAPPNNSPRFPNCPARGTITKRRAPALAPG